MAHARAGWPGGQTPLPPPRAPGGGSDAGLVAVPVAVVSSCVLLLCAAWAVQHFCGGASVKRGASMSPAKDGWFAVRGRRRADYLLDRWEDGLRGAGIDTAPVRTVGPDLRREIDERGGPALAPRFVPNADVGPLHETGDGEAPVQRTLFDLNDPFDDVLSWGGVSVHEGKSITFRKWSERCAVSDLPLFNPNPNADYFYFEAMLSLVGPDTAWVEAHRMQQAAAASAQNQLQIQAQIQSQQAMLNSYAAAAQALGLQGFSNFNEPDVPPSNYDRSAYDRDGSSPGPSNPTSPTSPRATLAHVLSAVGFGHPSSSSEREPLAPGQEPARPALRRRNSAESVLSFETVNENDTRQRRRVYIPSSRTLQSLMPTRGDPHVSMAIGLCARPYPPFLLPGRHFHSVSYVTTSNGAWLSVCLEDDFGREVQRVYNLGLTGGWVARQGDTVGVGYHPRRGGIFFTINGRRIPIPLDEEELGKRDADSEEDREPLLAGSAALRDEWAQYFAVEDSRYAWHPVVGSTGPGVVLVNTGRDEFLFHGSNFEGDIGHVGHGATVETADVPVPGGAAGPAALGSPSGSAQAASPNPSTSGLDVMRRPSTSASERAPAAGPSSAAGSFSTSHSFGTSPVSQADLVLPLELRRAYLQDPVEAIDAALDNVRILNPQARSILARSRAPRETFVIPRPGTTAQAPPPDYETAVTPPPGAQPAAPSPERRPSLASPSRPRTPRLRADDDEVRGHRRNLSGTPAPDPPGAERVSLQIRRSIEDFRAPQGRAGRVEVLKEDGTRVVVEEDPPDY